MSMWPGIFAQRPSLSRCTRTRRCVCVCLSLSLSILSPLALLSPRFLSVFVFSLFRSVLSSVSFLPFCLVVDHAIMSRLLLDLFSPQVTPAGGKGAGAAAPPDPVGCGLSPGPGRPLCRLALEETPAFLMISAATDVLFLKHHSSSLHQPFMYSNCLLVVTTPDAQ